jgi:hypothetical protein
MPTLERRLNAIQAHLSAPDECTHGYHIITLDITLDALRARSNAPESSDAPDETGPACGVCGLEQATYIIEVVTPFAG